MSDKPKNHCEHRLEDKLCDCTFLLFACKGCERRSCNVHGTLPYCYDCRIIMSDLEAQRIHTALVEELQRRRSK